MNKSIALLIIGVISLAMFLIMINQATINTNTPPLVGVENPLPQTAIPSSAALNPPTAPAGQHTESTLGQASGLLTPVRPSTALTPPTTPQALSPSAPEVRESQAPHENAQASRAAPERSLPTKAPNPASTKPAQTVPAEKAEKVAPKVNGPKIINKISVSATENGATVRIAGASSLNYRTMHLKNPDRIVVDLEGIWAVKAPGVPTNKAVKNVRIGKQGNKTRIVIDLSTPPASIAFVKANAETLEVRVK